MKNSFAGKISNLFKYHLHIILYSYFWLGLFICGLAAPDWRVKELGSNLITKGWHLSLISLFLVLPVPVIYYIRIRRVGSTNLGSKKE